MKIRAPRTAHLFLPATFAWLCALAGCVGDGEAVTNDPERLAAIAAIPLPKIESVAMQGPGCSDEALSAIGISGSRDTVRINFGRFGVSLPDEAGAAESACTVSVVLEGAEGVSYAPAGVTLTASGAAGATLSAIGAWADTPEQTSEDLITFPGSGPYLTGALNHKSLWSSCEGPRELRLVLKLSLDGKPGSASVEQLRNLRFVARACEAPGNGARDAGESLDAGASTPDAGEVATIDAASTDALAELDASLGEPEPDAGPNQPSLPAAIVVSDVLTAGSACPASSAAVRMAGESDSFEVRFDRFALAADAARTLRTSDCSVNVQVDVPEGRTVAIERFTLHGSASLPAGATARLTTYYSYVGVPRSSASKVVPLAGPFDGPFALAAEFVEGDLLFRNCGESRRRLNIRLALSVRAGEGGAPARAGLEQLGAVRFVSRSCE